MDHCDWREAWILFEGIDFEKEADALEFTDRMIAFRDSIDPEGLSRQAEAKICREKRRYSVGNRTMPPLGCYEPSEAMIACTNNITKGRLVKKAEDPAYTYDYDEAGNVVCICHLYSKEDGPRLHGKVAGTSYCLHDEQADLFINWGLRSTGGYYREPFGRLEMLIMTIRDEEGRIRYIAKSSFSTDQVHSEVEIYGKSENGIMQHDRYSFWPYTLSEVKHCEIIWDRMTIRCDEAGKPKKFLDSDWKVLNMDPRRKKEKKRYMDFWGFIEDIQKKEWNVFGVECYDYGRMTHRWGDKVNRHPIYSATKTITSIAVGMAVDEGKMDIHRSVLEYLPAAAVAKMDEAQRKIYEEITVKRLLTMSVCGYPFRPEGESWLDEALRYEIPDVKRTEFDYSNVSAYLVGVAAANAVGENLYDYLNERLFKPLEIHEPPHIKCPDGYFYGASGMELTINELSRIGLMLMQGGVYKGKRILSEGYVKEATSVQQMNREGGYGYFIWKYRDGFSINGKWGQKCYVLLENGRMVTFLSHIEEKCPELRESVEKHMLEIDG